MGCAGSAGTDFTASDFPQLSERYELLEFMGKGSFGRVWAARVRDPKRRSSIQDAEIAVKMVLLETEHGHKPPRVDRERDLWQKLGCHPNIVTLHSHWLETRASVHYAFFVMERCFENLRDRRPQQHEFHRVFADVLEAVTHVHGCGIIHRDVKLSNLLWSDNRVKLCDFGTAHDFEADGFPTTSAGSTPYMSPEVISCMCYSYPADIWSTGVVFYRILYSKLPFAPASARADRRAFAQAVLTGPEPEFPHSEAGDDAVHLCRAMLTRESWARPTARCALDQMRLSTSASEDTERSATEATISDTPSDESDIDVHVTVF